VLFGVHFDGGDSQTLMQVSTNEQNTTTTTTIKYDNNDQ
jgi:hypothetical protein